MSDCIKVIYVKSGHAACYSSRLPCLPRFQTKFRFCQTFPPLHKVGSNKKSPSAPLVPKVYSFSAGATISKRLNHFDYIFAGLFHSSPARSEAGRTSRLPTGSPWGTWKRTGSVNHQNAQKSSQNNQPRPTESIKNNIQITYKCDEKAFADPPAGITCSILRFDILVHELGEKY